MFRKPPSRLESLRGTVTEQWPARSTPFMKNWKICHWNGHWKN
jgi:hypothetical protein